MNRELYRRYVALLIGAMQQPITAGDARLDALAIDALAGELVQADIVRHGEPPGVLYKVAQLLDQWLALASGPEWPDTRKMLPPLLWTRGDLVAIRDEARRWQHSTF